MALDLAASSMEAMNALLAWCGPWVTQVSQTLESWWHQGQQATGAAVSTATPAVGQAAATASKTVTQVGTEVLKRPDILGGLFLGVCLSAACGFRVFAPPLVVSAASLLMGLQLPDAVAWLGTWPALATLSGAVVVEMLAYYIPFVNHLLDVIASPLAMLAGTLMTYTFLTGQIDPLWLWVLAIIAGGGSAALVQTGTVGTRATAGALSFGLATPLVATVENILAIALSALPLILPAIAVVIGAGVLLVLVPVLAVLLLRGLWRKKPPQLTGQTI